VIKGHLKDQRKPRAGWSITLFQMNLGREWRKCLLTKKKAVFLGSQSASSETAEMPWQWFQCDLLCLLLGWRVPAFRLWGGQHVTCPGPDLGEDISSTLKVIGLFLWYEISFTKVWSDLPEVTQEVSCCWSQTQTLVLPDRVPLLEGTSFKNEIKKRKAFGFYMTKEKKT
jgi:hypothetical protein